jgi:hypothetical protein
MASFPVEAELAKDMHGHTEWADAKRGNGDGSEYLDEKANPAKSHEDGENLPVTKTPTYLNEHAHKGDDSDGHVAMTPKRFIAMLILCMSYVGMASLYLSLRSFNQMAQVLNYPFSSWAGA